MKKKIKKMKKKKTKMGYFKVGPFASEHGRMPLRLVYSMAGVFLTKYSFFSAIFSLFRIFVPTSRENKTTRPIPT